MSNIKDVSNSYTVHIIILFLFFFFSQTSQLNQLAIQISSVASSSLIVSTVKVLTDGVLKRGKIDLNR